MSIYVERQRDNQRQQNNALFLFPNTTTHFMNSIVKTQPINRPQNISWNPKTRTPPKSTGLPVKWRLTDAVRPTSAPLALQEEAAG